MASTEPEWSLRTLAGRLRIVAVLGGIAALAISLFHPSDLTTAILGYLLLLAALAMWLLVRLVAMAQPPLSDDAFLQALRPARPPILQPAAVQQLERQLTYARMSALDLHYRLRPMLREIAAQRLAAYHNISLDADGDRAAALLGPTAWELLRPKRLAPGNRHARGLSRAELAALVTTLEGIRLPDRTGEAGIAIGAANLKLPKKGQIQ